MSVTFYKCSDDPKVLDKTLTAIGTLSNITISPTDSVSILNPVLIMGYDSNYIDANYCKISEFGNRYYFCSVSVAPGQRCIVKCTIDPLYSFKSGLLNIPVTVIRSESAGINYVPDKQLPIDPKRFYVYGAELNNPFKHTAGRNYAVVINSTYQ